MWRGVIRLWCRLFSARGKRGKRKSVHITGVVWQRGGILTFFPGRMGWDGMERVFFCITGVSVLLMDVRGSFNITTF